MSLFADDDSLNRVKEIESSIKGSFAKIREEMEDHLDAINENTNELQSAYEYVCELDNKIDKLNEKIEQLSLSIKQLATQQIIAKARYFLTYDEQKVFIILYYLGEQKGPLSSSDISIRMNSTELLVKTCIKNMVGKNIPIIEHVIDDDMYYDLEKDFKELQTRENVLNIDEALIRDVMQ